MVQQSVEHGGSECGVVVEDLGPFAVDAVGGDDGGAALVALAEDLEQQVGAGFVDGQVPQLVQDEDAGFEEAVQRRLEGACGLGGGERVDRVDGAGEQHRVVRLAGPQAERDGQMRLAQADAADEHDVAGRLHEPQPDELAEQIIENLEAGLNSFREVLAGLR